jgi:hypothetical protein
MKRIELFIGFALFLSAMMAQGKVRIRAEVKEKVSLNNTRKEIRSKKIKNPNNPGMGNAYGKDKGGLTG